MLGMRGVNWIFFQDNFPESGPCSELDDTITFELETNTEELTLDPDRVCLNVLRYVFFATNWDQQISSSTDSPERLLRAAYSFNQWGEPKKLQSP
ncbi:MAG: hypothetical protein HY820_44460 [Acidobacteria bacterium]|nr:hypothetical protein [Acidobacteriota bacterium]